MAGKGGAWKVAFADFMTAMMAFFLVMWLTAQDKEILIATSKYFQNPFTSPMEQKSGLLNFDSNKPANTSGGDKGETGGGKSSTSAQTIDLQFLNSVAKDVYKMLNLDEALADKPIDVQVTSDGLRITLYDRAKQPLFEDMSPRFTTWGDTVMQSLAWIIERKNFFIVIEGHTRAGLNFTSTEYTPWELSADRANAARRALVKYAVNGDQIERVTGYADTRPVPLMAPDSQSNQRVTLSLRLGRKTEPKKPSAPAPASNPAPTNAAAISPKTEPAPAARPKANPTH
jgi:chemotaxis protein MotB